MAEAGSWPAIQQHGLLSTTALLDLYEIQGDDRNRLESVRRPESVPINHLKVQILDAVECGGFLATQIL